MNVLRIRLLLDFLAVALIVACLAYWWLENLYHELFGTALFALVIVHNVLNGRWYRGVARRRIDPVRIVNLITIACLAVGMTIMLVTSLLISRDLFPYTALGGAFAVREIHMFAAYWLLLIVAVHLGTRWQVVIAVVSGMFGISSRNVYRTAALRLSTIGIAFWGVLSFSEMALGEKLMLTYALDMWDFNEATLSFFVNYSSIVGLFAAVTHYSLLIVKKGER